jgi:hypothetical protein
MEINQTMDLIEKQHEFYRKLQEWSNAGIIFTSEMIAAFHGKDAPGWMKHLFKERK